MVENRSPLTIIILLVSLALGVFLVWPRYQDFISVKEEVAVKEKEFQSKAAYYAELKQALVELDNYQDQISKINSALPKTSPLSLPEILNFLQRSSSQAGLTLEAITPLAISPFSREEISEIKETKINLSLRGDYIPFKKFLSIIEKSARLIESESISFSSPKEGPFTFNLTVKVSGY